MYSRKRPASASAATTGWESRRLRSASSLEECFLKAIEIARKQQAKSLELRATMSLIRLRQQQATQHAARTRLELAHNMLSEIYGWFTEGFDTKDLLEAKAFLAELQENLD